MEKIALKNTQQGSSNTYEIITRTNRQLIASSARFVEIKEADTLTLYYTSQERTNLYGMPIAINAVSIVLYFSNGNGQNMRLVMAGASFSQDFVAPIGEGTISISLPDVFIDAGDNQRMDIINLETTAITPQPVLSDWCITYNIP